jgi:hypothetical protein
MKIKVENDNIVIYELNEELMVYEDQPIYKVRIELSAQELAKALKPYIDSIPNWECKGEIK